MADGQWLRSARSCARILGAWRPMARRCRTATAHTITCRYSVCGFDLQMWKKLTTNTGCSSRAAFSSCKRIPVKPVATSMSASVLSRASGCFSSTSTRLNPRAVAGKGSTLARTLSTTNAARSFTTVRGSGESHEKKDGGGAARRTRTPKKLNRIEREKIWYRNRIQKQCKRGNEEEALTLFEEMKTNRIYPEVVMFNNLIAALGRKGKVKEAFKLFNDLKKRALLPTEHTYTSLFNACAVAGKCSHTYLQKIREEMDRRGVIPNTPTCNAMIKAYAMSGQTEEAFDVYASMPNWRSQPDLLTFSFLLMAACEDDEEGLDRGLQVWQEMAACCLQPDLYSYNLMLRCYRDGGIPQGLLQPSGSESVIVSEQDGRLKCDVEGAVGYVPLHLTKQHSLQLFLSTKGERWLEEGDVKHFLSVMAMPQSEVAPDIKTFQLLLGLLRSLPLSRDHFFWKILKENGVEPDLQLMNSLVELQATNGDNLNGAKAIMRFMGAIGVAPDVTTYKKLALGCRRSSDGLQLLKEMKSAGLGVNEEIFAVLLATAFRNRNYSFMVCLMKEMKRAAILPDQKIKSILSRAAEPSDQYNMSSAMKKRLHGYRGYLVIWKRAMWVSDEGDTPKDENKECEGTDSREDIVTE